MRRYLFVLDMDLLAVDEELDLQPINYLVARQEQEPCEVVVMSLSGHARHGCQPCSLLSRGIWKFPFAPQPDHDVGAAAEHRMDLPYGN